jgi:hypothetical protein
MHTTSLYKVAKDISTKTGFSLQAINKRVKSELLKGENKALCDNTEQTTTNGKTSIRLNDNAVSAVYELYNLVDQPVSQPVDQPHINETEYLRQQLNDLQKAYIDLSNQLADITKENQIIAKQQQQLALADKSALALPPKRNFLLRLLGRT